MKCFNHPEKDAVMQCKCSKGLCPECANQFQPPMCFDCAKAIAIGEVDTKAEAVKRGLADLRAARNKAYFFLLWLAAFIALGLYLTYPELTYPKLTYPEILDEKNWQIVLGCFVSGGAIWLFFGHGDLFITSHEDKIADIRDDIRYGPGAAAAGGCIFSILKIACFFVFSLILIPIFMGVSVFRILSFDIKTTRLMKKLSSLEEEMGELRQMNSFPRGE